VLQSGWRRTAPGAGYFDLTLAAGGSATGRNFADTQNVLISGSVFNDLNGNGVRNTGEAGLASWRIFIDANKNGVLDTGEMSVLTDSSGNWSFKTLAAGTYAVRIVQQTGWKRTTPAGGSFTVTVSSGGRSTGKLFGEKK
jgi:uncharacterized protein (DUF2141 family)